MKRLHIARSVAVSLVAALTISACSSAGGSSSSAGGEGTITYLGLEPSQGLDPNAAFADASKSFMAMFYETLIERDENSEYVGALAESWDVSEDLLTYTFRLRDGIKFSDGSPITVQDVIWSFDRMKTGAVLGGPLANLDKAVDAGDGSVALKLKKPDNSFMATVASVGSAAILSQAAVEKGGEDYFTKPVATSGPWELASYLPKSRAEFKVNPGYFVKSKITGVTWNFTADITSAASAIESGSAHLAGVNYSDVERMKKIDGVKVSQADALNILFWGWDRTKPPFNDKLVRQAFAWAVDREGKQQSCWYGTGGIIYGGVLRPWDPNYIELNTYKSDSREDAIAKAGELLDEAGWVLDGDKRVARGVAGVSDGTALSVTVPYESNWPAAECHTLVLQQDMKKVGVTIKPEKYDPAAYYGDVAAGKFQMYHAGAGAVDSADLYRNWFHTGGTLTGISTGLKDPAIDAQIDEALSSTDPAAAKAIYADLEKWQAEELPMLAVGNQWAQFVSGPRLIGYAAVFGQDSYALVRASVKN